MNEDFEVKKVSDTEWVVIDNDLGIEVASFPTEQEAVAFKQRLELE